MSDKLKIVFAGTPEIAKMVLANILAANFDVRLVLTQPDRPAGRGMKLTPSPVKQLALEHGIEVFQPLSFKKDLSVLQKIREINPDIVVVVAYGLIVPQEFLDIPRLGCVNIHVSLLPYHRGAAPIQRAVLAGDSETGVTIMQMDAGLDTGDMLLVEKVAIANDETSASLHDKLAQIGAAKIVEFLANPTSYPPVKQSESGVTYAHKLEKEEAKINWQEDAAVIERKIRGFNPFPGAYSLLDGQLHKFWQASVRVDKNHNQPAGSIIGVSKDAINIACGNGSILEVKEIQEAGSKRKPVTQYLHNKPDLVGKIFMSEVAHE